MAKKLINFVNDDGSVVAIETNAPDLNRSPGAPGLPIDTPTSDVPVVPDVPRLRKVPAAVDEQDLAIIRRAVTLWNATAGYCEVDDPARNGHAIADICEKWLLTESARLRAKGSA